MGWVAPFKCVVEIASDIRKAGLQENVCFFMMYNSHIFRIQKIQKKKIHVCNGLWDVCTKFEI
jgi:hypothetical protein